MMLRVLDSSELGSILDYVHDQTYELEQLQFDRDHQELRISIHLSRNRGIGSLTIRNVSSFRVRDDALIGEGDINTIEYEHPKVIIKGAIPVDIVIHVSSLEIEWVLPDNVCCPDRPQ